MSPRGTFYVFAVALPSDSVILDANLMISEAYTILADKDIYE